MRGAATPAPGIYRRIGVRPFINLKAAFTIDGGLLTLARSEAGDGGSFL